MKRFFLNYKIDKRELKRLLAWFVQTYGSAKATQFADTLKFVGFHYAMRAGISIGIEDLQIPPARDTLVGNSQVDTTRASLLCERGEITALEKFRKVIDTWAWTSEKVKREVIVHFRANHPLNPVYMMAFSGARGNVSQVRQLIGMRGLMSNPKGELIDLPIRTNFKEGLTVVEYIISCYGSRKGVVDTALRTANSGYLTRRLIEVVQDVSIGVICCESTHGIPARALWDNDTRRQIVPLHDRLIGRVLAETVHPEMALRGQDITPEMASAIGQMRKRVFIRSPFTCCTTSSILGLLPVNGIVTICQYCYGWNLADSALVSIGEAVGVIAAQSIGEPGTQLTMRTFHTGGVFSGSVTEKLVAPHGGTMCFAQAPAGAPIATLAGRSMYTLKGEWAFFNYTPMWIAILGSRTTVFEVPPGSVVFRPPGHEVHARQIMGEVTTLGELRTLTQRIPNWWEEDPTEAREGISSLLVHSERSGQVYFDKITVLLKENYRNMGRLVVSHGRHYFWVLAGEVMLGSARLSLGDLVYRAPANTSGSGEGTTILDPAPLPSDEQWELDLRAHPNLYFSRHHYVYATLPSKPGILLGEFVRIGDRFTESLYTNQSGMIVQSRLDPDGWSVTLREAQAHGVSLGVVIEVYNGDIVQTGDPIINFVYKREKTGDIVQGLPKIDQLFEARQRRNNDYLLDTPKNVAICWFLSLRRRGVAPRHATAIGLTAAQDFLLSSIQRAYRTQGVALSDKHMEVVIRRMCSYVMILEMRQTPLLPSEILDHDLVAYVNSLYQPPALYVPVVFGITRLGLQSPSFLSAASFQHTRRMLMHAAMNAKFDNLQDIKQCVMLGHLLPLGPMNAHVFKEYHALTPYGIAGIRSRLFLRRPMELEPPGSNQFTKLYSIWRYPLRSSN